MEMQDIWLTCVIDSIHFCMFTVFYLNLVLKISSSPFWNLVTRLFLGVVSKPYVLRFSVQYRLECMS